MTQKELQKLKNAILEQGLENTEAVILYGGYNYCTSYYALAKAKEIVECDKLPTKYKHYKETDFQSVPSYIWTGKELELKGSKVYIQNPKNKKFIAVSKGRGFRIFDIHKDEVGYYVWCLPSWLPLITKELEK